MQASAAQASKAWWDESHHLCSVSVKSNKYILTQGRPA